jgi:hypothetical protein
MYFERQLRHDKGIRLVADIDDPRHRERRKPGVARCLVPALLLPAEPASSAATT